MVNRLRLNISLIFLFLITFVSTSWAAALATSDEPALTDLAKSLLQAVRDGHGWIAAATALVIASTAARRYIAPRVEFFKTPLGALTIVFTGAYGAAVLTGLAAAGTSTLTASLAFTAFQVAITAAGGYAVLRPLLVDLVEPFFVKRWPWLAPVFDLLTWAFDKPDSIKQAEAAGDAAVAAKPSTGLNLGTPTEIE